MSKEDRANNCKIFLADIIQKHFKAKHLDSRFLNDIYGIIDDVILFTKIEMIQEEMARTATNLNDYITRQLYLSKARRNSNESGSQNGAGTGSAGGDTKRV